jgi:hypothetical protein
MMFNFPKVTNFWKVSGVSDVLWVYSVLEKNRLKIKKAATVREPTNCRPTFKTLILKL